MEHAALHVDVSDTSSVEDLFKAIRNLNFNPVSILVNCAGIGAADTPISETSTDVFERVTNVNLKVSFRRHVSALILLYDETGKGVYSRIMT